MKPQLFTLPLLLFTFTFLISTQSFAIELNDLQKCYLEAYSGAEGKESKYLPAKPGALLM
jgi:hypothetical protein